MRPILYTVACAAVAVLSLHQLLAAPREVVRERPPTTDVSSPAQPAHVASRSSSPAPIDSAALRAAGARLLLSLPEQPGEGTASVANPGLERALEEEGDDAAWTLDVQRAVREALAEDPEVHLDAARCTPTFCRLRLTKPIESRLDWPEIDQRLAPIARGETLFNALPHGRMTTAHVYFSALDSSLPLDTTSMAEAEDDG